MFEDLLGRRSVSKKVKDLLNGEACPTCSSRFIKIIYGFFASADRYIQKLECETCKECWNVVYDGDLNVVDTSIGG